MVKTTVKDPIPDPQPGSSVPRSSARRFPTDNQSVLAFVDTSTPFSHLEGTEAEA